jgi:riboflavin transporter FmnP
VSQLDKQSKTIRLTGTAIIAALVIVFDYTLKYSGLKLPFPWYPNIKFDFTGVPITLGLFLYGFSSSVTASIVAGLGIILRSGNIISAFLKVLAELSTVTGIHLGRNILKKSNKNEMKLIPWSLGLISRVLTMSIANLYVFPNVYKLPFEVTIGLLPLVGIFNVIQGIINIGLGYFLFGALKSRLPHWAP